MSVSIERTVVYARKEAPERVGGKDGILLAGEFLMVTKTDCIITPMEITREEQGEAPTTLFLRFEDLKAIVIHGAPLVGLVVTKAPVT